MHEDPAATSDGPLDPFAMKTIPCGQNLPPGDPRQGGQEGSPKAPASKAYKNASEDARNAMRERLIKQMNGALEHLRWQAYMWAEGYQKGLYKSSIDKTHHKLVATNQRMNVDAATSENLTGLEEENSSNNLTQENN